MLRPQPLEPVPDETARVPAPPSPPATSICGCVMRWDPLRGHGLRAPVLAAGPPGAAAWRLALVTVVQFAEDLSDRRPRTPSAPGST